MALALVLAFTGIATSVAEAHRPALLDGSSHLWEEAYPAYATGGPAGEALESFAGDAFAPERTGGQPTPSRTHHGNVTHRIPIVNCPSPATPSVVVSSPTPVAPVDVEAGVVEATGAFELALDVDGPASPDVERIWIGLGANAPGPAAAGLCALEQPGVWAERYREDVTKGDGFSVYLNTLLSPDGPYGLVVRALTQDGRVLGAGFAYVEVNNHLDDRRYRPGTPVECRTIENLCPYHDTTPPYPHVEGAHGNARTGEAADRCPEGVVLAYAEPIEEIEATKGELEPIGSTEREVDVVPLVEHARTEVGPRYCWTGAAPGEHVEAVDQSDNTGVVPAELG